MDEDGRSTNSSRRVLAASSISTESEIRVAGMPRLRVTGGRSVHSVTGITFSVRELFNDSWNDRSAKEELNIMPNENNKKLTLR